MPTDLGRDQHDHWESVYGASPRMYGRQPSQPARYAAKVFHAEGAQSVLELGSGHGRDALHFAREGFAVQAIDTSFTGLEQLRSDADHDEVGDRVRTTVHDARTPLPLPGDSVDGVFAHMLLCMALSTTEIHALVGEIGRVLRPSGSLIYTVRHTGDAHYGAGTGHGEDIYEHGKFAVHFFSRALVDELARGWTLQEVHPFDEGDLPRRLWRVTQTLPRSEPDRL
jgi:SAM-dependent methyltransferase